MKWKKATLVFLAAILLLTAVACSGGNTNSGAGGDSGTNAGGQPSDQKPEQITLRVAWWGGQERHDRTLEVIKRYEELNPHVKIEAEFSSYNGYWEKMAAQAAGNNLPDVINQNFGEYLTQYTQRGLLYDLTEFTKNGLIDVSDVDQSVLDSGTLDGKLVGISLGTNAYAAMYDPALFQQAGAEEPKLGWTWDDVDQRVKKVAEVADYGVDNLESNRVFEIYLRQHGYRLFNDDGTGLGYDDDQLMADFLKMKLDWVESGAAPTLDIANQHTSLEDSLIVHGKVGLMFAWSNQLVSLSKAANRPLKIAPMPGPNEDKGMYLKPSMFFSISNNSKHKEEAAKFINFFTNDVEANKILKAERGVPISAKVREAIKPELDEATQQTFDFIEAITPHTSPIDKNHPVTAAEILKLIDEIDEKVLYKQITPEEGAKEFRKKAEAVLKR